MSNAITLFVTTIITACAIIYIIRRIQTLDSEIKYCRKISTHAVTITDVEQIVKRHAQQKRHKKRVTFADEKEEATHSERNQGNERQRRVGRQQKRIVTIPEENEPTIQEEGAVREEYRQGGEEYRQEEES